MRRRARHPGLGPPSPGLLRPASRCGLWCLFRLLFRVWYVGARTPSRPPRRSEARLPVSRVSAPFRLFSCLNLGKRSDSGCEGGNLRGTVERGRTKLQKTAKMGHFSRTVRGVRRVPPPPMSSGSSERASSLRKTRPASRVSQPASRSTLHTARSVRPAYGRRPMPPSRVRVSPERYLKSGLASCTTTRPISFSTSP